MGGYKNLLRETLDDMKRVGRSPGDVLFIGSINSGHSCTWSEFARLADVTYYSGFGGAEVAQDLRIVFTDGSFMHRGEYDGSEWWDFCAPALDLPAERKPIRSLVREDGYGESLAAINTEATR